MLKIMATLCSRPHKMVYLEFFVEGLPVMGFVFDLVGVVAFLRLEKLTNELKAKGILDEDYKEE